MEVKFSGKATEESAFSPYRSGPMEAKVEVTLSKEEVLEALSTYIKSKRNDLGTAKFDRSTTSNSCIVYGKLMVP